MTWHAACSIGTVDRPRTDQASRRRKRALIALASAGLITVTCVVVARLQPAPPSVERALIWVDTVKRGPMVRQIRGTGILKPEDVQWIVARTPARVESVRLQPGSRVQADDIVMILNNPDVVQAAADADSQVSAAEAELLNTKVQLQSALLAAESTAAASRAAAEQAKLRAEVNAKLFKEQLVSQLELRLSQVTAENAAAQSAIEHKRFEFARASVAPQLAVKAAALDRARALAATRHAELDALSVRAGMNGVLQLVPVEVGAQVAAGANLARVADPARLKAEIRIAETQAKDIEVGQLATIDTRHELIKGQVARIDPAVTNGTVTVDVTFVDTLPPGARPDLAVEGTIELERLADAMFVGRPAYGGEQDVVSLYRFDSDSGYARLTKVRLGRGSASNVEILSGLSPGDRVILSDMSQWDGAPVISLQ